MRPDNLLSQKETSYMQTLAINSQSEPRCRPASIVGRDPWRRFGQGPTVTPDFFLIHRAIEAQAAKQPEGIAARHLG